MYEFEDQQHILTCKVLLKELKSGELVFGQIGGISYEDPFSEHEDKEISIQEVI